MMDSSSLSIPVPNMIASSPSGGRFDFDDGGVYCGGWQDGKAHGHGVCTGPKNVGEYSGSWNFGFEMSGVYKWKNGAVYEGRWQNGKRHGVGVEYNGKWIYKGEWSQGFKGRYGVKASSNSAVKYEGTWANGLQDGYGSETYSDGGYYQGQMCRGLRHGYGVRKSAPYGDSQLNNPAKSNGATNSSQQLSQMGASSSMMIHSNSLQSSNSVDIAISSDDDSPKLDDGFKPNIDRTLASKNGFVLVAKPLDCTLPKQLTTTTAAAATNILGDSINSFSKSSSNRRNSLTNRLASAAASRIPGSNHSSSAAAAGSIFKGFRGLRKQKSTSDLADQPLGGRSSASRMGSTAAATAAAASELHSGAEALVPFTLSPEELDITDPTTVETYTGEWKQDKRNGHGVCERSDGLKYEGQWHNDMKCGYGMTTFKDGTKEEGKYKNNILIADSKVKRFLHFGSSNIRQRIDDAIKMAHQAQTMALKKAEIADTRAATARDKADQATTAALEADRDSQIAFSVARQYSSDSQQQLGMSFAAQPALSSILAMQDYGSPIPMQPAAFNHGPAGNHQMGAAGASLSHPNALQMRRASHHQHQQQYNRFAPSYDHDGMMQQQQQEMDQQLQLDQQQQQQQQMSGPKQFLAAVEPFNGRRGSFRGGSHATQFNLPGGSRSSPFSSSGGGGGGGSQLSHQHQQQHQHHHHPYQQAPSMGLNRQSSTSDPFSDLFDHYKSTPAAGQDGFHMQQQQQHGMRSRNRMLSRQTSLDVAGPRGLQQQQQQQRGAMQRMSSMDHAEENHQQRHSSMMDPNNAGNMEQQLRHLVTSGEELGHSDSADRAAPASGGGGGPTPSNSSYILAGQSSQNTNSQNSSSSFYGGGGGGGTNQATPSPEAAAGPSSSNRPRASQSRYYSYQQPVSNYPSQQAASHSQIRQHQQQQQHFYNDHQQHSRQRDAQSLADDQLYAAGSRRMLGVHQMDHSTLDESEFSHYDFVISSAPRMARRVMRRTNSLSRNTPIRSISEFRHSTQQFETNTNNSLLNLRQRSVSPSAFQSASNRTAFQQQQHQPGRSQQQQQQQLTGVSSITVTTEAPATVLSHPNNTGLNSNQQQQQQQQQMVMDAHSPTSHLTVDSSLSAGSSTASAHARKPSLQVRYNPDELGGLMSREEVAALSHAQREQKRLEVELAESRAKRPLLHLYLSIKEFLIQRKLVLSVLMINICLFEMFANLIV